MMSDLVNISYSRSLTFGDALIFGKQWGVDGRVSLDAVKVPGRTTRSYVSLEKESTNNLYEGEECRLPEGTDTLSVNFSFRVNNNAKNPSGNRTDAIKLAAAFHALSATVPLACDKLAGRIFNGNWAWRNNEECVKKIVSVVIDGVQFDQQALAVRMTEALTGGSPFVADVRGEFQLGSGTEVYPSQLMKSGTSDKGKEFYQARLLNGSSLTAPAIRGVKIGNAIRTIDTWYDGFEDSDPIAVEAYGSSLRWSEDFRRNGNNFFDYIGIALADDDSFSKLLALPENEKVYLLAMMLRGGLFVTETKASKGSKKREQAAKEAAKATE